MKAGAWLALAVAGMLLAGTAMIAAAGDRPDGPPPKDRPAKEGQFRDGPKDGPREGPKDGPPRGGDLGKTLDQKVGLTDEQKAKVAELSKARDAAIMEIIKKFRADVMALLTPEQKAKLPEGFGEPPKGDRPKDGPREGDRPKVGDGPRGDKPRGEGDRPKPEGDRK